MLVVEDVPTRERVVKSILEEGASTAVELAQRLRLTPAAVRRHLDQLIADDAIVAREQRVDGHRGRGRPAKVFVVTKSGRDWFDQKYDELAADALRFLSQTGGDAAVMAFARHRVEDLEERYRPLVAAAKPVDRPQALADALTVMVSPRRHAMRPAATRYASTIARWPTWQRNSRNCVKPKPRSSPACSAATSNDLPPLLMATASARPMFPTSHLQ